MAALVIKIGALLLKQLAKPLSANFQSFVMAHPTARRQAVAASQYMHRWEVWINRSADGKTSRTFVGDMNEEKSLELASKLVSEGFVFGVGLAIVAFEYDRQMKKENAKKAAEKAEKKKAEDEARAEREHALRTNVEQTEMLQALVARLDTLEGGLQKRIDDAIAAHHAAKRGSGMFGGLLGPRGHGVAVGVAAQ